MGDKLYEDHQRHTPRLHGNFWEIGDDCDGGDAVKV